MFNYKNYIRYDSKNRIVKVFSNSFEEPLNTDICVDENGPRCFQMDLYDSDYNLKYKYVDDDNKIVERNIEEIKQDDEYIQKQIQQIKSTAQSIILSAYPLEKQLSYKNDFDFAVAALSVVKKLNVQDIQYTILTWLNEQNNDLQILQTIDTVDLIDLYSEFSITNKKKEDFDEFSEYVKSIIKGIIIYRLILSVRQWSNEQETYGEITNPPPTIA
jgi:hypothetical protein